jgi:hypothetical protein
MIEKGVDGLCRQRPLNFAPGLFLAQFLRYIWSSPRVAER